MRLQRILSCLVTGKFAYLENVGNSLSGTLSETQDLIRHGLSIRATCCRLRSTKADNARDERATVVGVELS